MQHRLLGFKEGVLCRSVVSRHSYHELVHSGVPGEKARAMSQRECLHGFRVEIPHGEFQSATALHRATQRGSAANAQDNYRMCQVVFE